ncbi:Hypothetical predicted protein, partial [Pelobates cultripes]
SPGQLPFRSGCRRLVVHGDAVLDNVAKFSIFGIWLHPPIKTLTVAIFCFPASPGQLPFRSGCRRLVVHGDAVLDNVAK